MLREDGWERTRVRTSLCRKLVMSRMRTDVSLPVSVRYDAVSHEGVCSLVVSTAACKRTKSLPTQKRRASAPVAETHDCMCCVASLIACECKPPTGSRQQLLAQVQRASVLATGAGVRNISTRVQTMHACATRAVTCNARTHK